MELLQRHIENTRLVPNRAHLLEHFPKNSVVAEIGVGEGGFAEKILALTEPKVLHLIDMWQSERFGADALNAVRTKFADKIESGQVVVHRGDAIDILSSLDDNTFDWVYLDTSHTYDDTLAELELCLLKVKDDGIIAGHDYAAGNVERGLRYGVVEAVNETCIKHDMELAYLTNESRRLLSFAIRKF